MRRSWRFFGSTTWHTRTRTCAYPFPKPTNFLLETVTLLLVLCQALALTQAVGTHRCNHAQETEVTIAIVIEKEAHLLGEIETDRFETEVHHHSEGVITLFVLLRDIDRKFLSPLGSHTPLWRACVVHVCLSAQCNTPPWSSLKSDM